MCAFYFKEFGKAASDLLSDDFSYKRKLKVKVPSPNGVTWSSEGDLTNKGVIAKLGAKYKHQSGISLDKFEVKTDGRILGEASLDVDPKLKLWISAEDGRQEAGKPIKSHGKLGFEYLSPGVVASRSEVDVVNGPTVDASAVVNVRGLLCGAQASYNTQLDETDAKAEFTDYNIGVSAVTKAWEASIRSYNKVNSLRFCLLSRVKPAVLFAAQLDYQVDKNTQELVVGGSFAPDPTTRLSAKITSLALLSLAYSQNISPFANLLISAEVDTKDWASDSHRFGLGLTLSA